jgi:molybdopterin/thiamine biosynthesis adenylyltransferase
MDRLIVAPAELLERPAQHGGLAVPFRIRDGGDVYSAIGTVSGTDVVPGRIFVRYPLEGVDVARIGSQEDRVRILAQEKPEPRIAGGCDSHGDWSSQGYVLQDGIWKRSPVIWTPVREELFSRSRGIFETKLVADKWVFTAGDGSMADPVVQEFGKLGLNQILMDADRIDLVNVVRHSAGLTDVGRYKTKYAADKLRNKNPYAQIETHQTMVNWETRDLVRKCVRKADLVIAGLDDPEGRLILNTICIEEEKPLIAGGAFRRAFGGQILVVLPGITPCLQCFQMALPDQSLNQEIATLEQAERVAYSDRPVQVEPGLSNDIAPLSQMIVKLGLQQLLKGKETSLRSLDDDLVASWYLWVNRREVETDYERLQPLGFEVDGMHILRWYGVAFERNKACPACGDFLGHLARTEGIELEKLKTL